VGKIGRVSDMLLLRWQLPVSLSLMWLLMLVLPSPFMWLMGIATAAARALIVDSVPTPQQNTANAWAGRMLGLGNVLGYLRSPLPALFRHGGTDYSGYTNLPKYFPSLGETQFQILCVLAPVFMVITVIVTCTAVKEVDPALLFVFPGQGTDQGGIQAAISVPPPSPPRPSNCRC